MSCDVNSKGAYWLFLDKLEDHIYIKYDGKVAGGGKVDIYDLQIYATCCNLPHSFITLTLLFLKEIRTQCKTYAQKAQINS